MLLREALNFVKSNTRNGWEKLPNGKRNIHEYAERAVLEGLINHFIHRDYTVMGGEVHLDIYDNRLTLTSPGGMYSGLFIQNLDIEGVPSDRRNPVLADVMAQLDYMEKRGSGLTRIYNATRELKGYKEELRPQFQSTQSHFITTIFNMSYSASEPNTQDSVVKDVVKDVVNELTERQQDIYTLISADVVKDVATTAASLARRLSVSERTIQRDLEVLQQKHLLKREGGKKDGVWITIKY